MVINVKNRYLAFEQLDPGDVFVVDDKYYMKTENSFENADGEYDNAVEVGNGELVYFDERENVKYIDCELTIC